MWWFYLFWVPGFLQARHGLALLQIGLPIVVIYLMADVGSVAGGWVSSSLIRRGHTVNFSRKMAMLICAIAVVPIVFAANVASTWSAVFLIGLAAAAHQGFSCNLFTLPSDMFPGKAVHGHVDSLAPASGQEFTLLPPDNATGNFTKVVQRIPVRIVLANCAGAESAGVSSASSSSIGGSITASSVGC